MKKTALIFLIIFFAVIAETSFFPVLWKNLSVPDLVLVLAVSGVAVFGFNSVWVWALASGIILDLFYLGKVGANSASFMIFSYGTSFFSRRLILGENTGGVLIGIGFISFMTVSNSLWLVLANSGFNFGFMGHLDVLFFERLAWKSALNTIIYFVLIMVFKRLKKRTAPPAISLVR